MLYSYTTATGVARQKRRSLLPRSLSIRATLALPSISGIYVVFCTSLQNCWQLLVFCCCYLLLSSFSVDDNAKSDLNVKCFHAVLKIKVILHYWVSVKSGIMFLQDLVLRPKSVRFLTWICLFGFLCNYNHLLCKISKGIIHLQFHKWAFHLFLLFVFFFKRVLQFRTIWKI